MSNKKIGEAKYEARSKKFLILIQLNSYSAILSSHVVVILTKFLEDWAKIVNFSSVLSFGASLIFFGTVKSTNSSGSCSRIPIKRNSSLRAKKGRSEGHHEGRNSLKYKSSCTSEEEPQTLVIDDPDIPGNRV